MDEVNVFLEEIKMQYETTGHINGLNLASLIGGLSDENDDHCINNIKDIISFCNKVYKREQEKNERIKKILRKSYYEREED